LGVGVKAKIAINGYGTIGKRVADAINAQPDMEIIGATKTRPTFEAKLANLRGIPLYAAAKDFVKRFDDAGLKVEGTLDDLLPQADLVIDCTPKKSGYREVYEKLGKKAIWQGGEKHEVTNLSFNSMANYEQAYGAQFVRVVSCNTTGLLRTLYPVYTEYGIDNVLAVMVRRAADPWDIKRGPINAIEPVLKVPSHHGPDVQSVVPDINIQTTAVKVPTTIMHLHSIVAKLKKNATSDDIVDLWKATPRIIFVSGADGIKSTAQIMELARDLCRERGDLYEIAVWEDGVHVVGNKLYFYQAIHQESDVVPENVDAIRSMLEMEEDKLKSMEMTDKFIGVC
jgi:glyceraldehyde-3-phosphate dehydrogenase (NAD(P))